MAQIDVTKLSPVDIGTGSVLGVKDNGVALFSGMARLSDLTPQNIVVNLGVDGSAVIDQRQKNSQVINVRDFAGVDPTGATASDIGFAKAIAAAAGKRLVAEGVFLFNNPVSLASNSDYDFYKATFIGGAGCDGAAVFRTLGKTEVRVYGGYSEMNSVTPKSTLETGAYTTFTFYYFENCINSSVMFSRCKRMFTVINFYNCVDCFAENNYTLDCNASFVAVRDTTVTGSACRNVNFRRNTILRGGDDGIAMLARGGDVVNCNADDNYVTKTTRTDSGNELDGAFAAATGLRAGRFQNSQGVNAGNIVGGGFRRNIGADMVTDFIRVHNAIDFDTLENQCDGFAKRSVEACYQFGIDATNTYLRGKISGNMGKNPVLTGRRVFFFNGVNYAAIDKNTGIGNINGDGTARFDNCTYNRIFANLFHNTVSRGLLLSATSNNNDVFDNDLSVFTTIALADFGTANKITDNKGLPTRTVGNDIVPAGIATRTVSHGIPAINSSLPIVNIQAKGAWFNATKAYVSNITTSQFTVTLDQNPTTGDFQFSWVAERV